MLNFLPPFFHSKKNPIIHHKIDDSKIHTTTHAESAQIHAQLRRHGRRRPRRGTTSVCVRVVVVHVLSLCLPLFFFRWWCARFFESSNLSNWRFNFSNCVLFVFTTAAFVCCLCWPATALSAFVCFFLSLFRSIDRNSWKRWPPRTTKY